MKLVVSVFVLLVAISVLGISRTIAVPGDFSTLEYAVGAASPGDVIELAPGEYETNVSIEWGLIIRGENAENVILRPAEWNAPIFLINSSTLGEVRIESVSLLDSWGERAIGVSGDSVAVVADCKIAGNVSGVSASDDAVVSIDGCTFGKYYENAVRGTTRAHVTILDSEFIGMSNTQTVFFGSDVVGVIERCTFRGVDAIGHAGDWAVWSNGWNGSGLSSLTIRDSSVSGFLHGIFSQHAGELVGERNTVSNCYSGFLVWNELDSTTVIRLDDNLLRNVDAAIVLTASVTSVEISNNVIKASKGRGIEIATDVLPDENADAYPFSGTITGVGNRVDAAKPVFPPPRSPFWPEGFFAD